MTNKRKIPINRINKWFSNEDFDLEISMGREAIEGDGNFKIILYRVDRTKTSYNDIYHESDEDAIRFLSPVELLVIPLIEAPENEAYNVDGGLRYKNDGKLSFGIYDEQLAELDVEIKYGDYIGYAVSELILRYYTVVDDGFKNFDNKHTIMGYKSAFRSIRCVQTDGNEFKGV